MDGRVYLTNPTRQVTAWSRHLVRLYHQSRSGMGGAGLLLEGGGLLDQPAIVAKAFDVIAACEAEARADG